MSSPLFFLLLLLPFFICVHADVYMHAPRGSNNRLNERSANRQNADRLFDSQNNNRGGYNVGDRSSQAFDATNYNTSTTTPDKLYDVSKLNINARVQYQMVYYEGSVLPIEYTAQHGCGGDEATDTHKLNCDIIIQYMCQTTNGAGSAPATGIIMGAEVLRDGTNTNTPDEPNTAADIITGATAARNLDEGHHESEAYYFECKTRSRNKGLFTADQVLNGNSAKFTRQNPNGNRRGLECPEERDYYPYWSPSPWKDIVVLTDHVEDMCDANGLYTGKSQNNNKVYKCIPADYTNTEAIKAITPTACAAANGEWTDFQHYLPKPLCQQAQWNRVNHLGNSRQGQPSTFNWTLPTVATLKSKGVYAWDVTQNDGSVASFAKCVLRLRYNISTDDYDPYNTTSAQNHNPEDGVISPVTQNPTVDIGADFEGLKLAINTAQFGRTFQDRSHTFYIRTRPANIPANAKIYNLNVRGKRGNIVQTFPAVEYDFVPSRLTVTPNDYIHVQWTGSNTHNNGDPGGDGQTGDAGEGRGGTDRSNIMQLLQFNQNYPLPLDKFPDNLWTRSTCQLLDGSFIGGTYSRSGVFDDSNAGALDCSIFVSTVGQYRNLTHVQADANAGAQPFDPLLDDAPASLIGGVLMQIKPQFAPNQRDKSYDYMCSRNNNFSNRGQKGTIVVNNPAVVN